MSLRRADESVISRHRLPTPFRQLLTALWLAPLLLFTLALLLTRGLSPALLDPRYLLVLAVMGLPALYVWREGVDVLVGGIKRRVYLPRYYAYGELHTWHLQTRAEGKILTIWHVEGEKILSTHARHLTDFPLLLDALREHVGR